MTDTPTTALIAAGGVVIGATVTAIASAFSARQKIRELDVTYKQRLREGYLANARAYTHALYVPLGILITRLSNAYLALRPHIPPDYTKPADPQLEVFLVQCHEYLSAMDGYFARGADAFLTSELDERVRTLNAFIRESMETDRPIVRCTMSTENRFGGMTFKTRQQLRRRSKWKMFSLVPKVDFRFSPLGGFAMNFEMTVLGAPIWTEEFEAQLTSDIYLLKNLIKEVTLGAHAS